MMSSEPMALNDDPVAVPEPNVDMEMEVDIGGTVLELEQEEISPLKGPRKEKLGGSPDFPGNPHWIKPELLLQEIWEKKRVLKGKDDNVIKFRFPSDPRVILRPYSWQIPELTALKDELNNVKMQYLNQFPRDAWYSHTKQMDIANTIMGHVTRFFNPEFSSEAWAKMFDIMCSYEIVPDQVYTEVKAISDGQKLGGKVAFDSVHLCEAPGAFISALNHFLKNSYPGVDWNWLATSLNPYRESTQGSRVFPDDRLILKKMNNWTFLEDNTGNILSLDNLNHLIKIKKSKLDKIREAKSKTKDEGSQVYLVTADGSVDDEDDYGANATELETHSMAHLQFAEILTAIKILEKGGSFVLKIFTFFEATTICHLYFLCCLFNEVHLFKPATSQEGNSEIYVICLEFLGTESVDKVLKEKLLPNFEKYGRLLQEGKLLLALNFIPKDFIDRIIESAGFFCNYQMKIMKRNLNTFPCDTRMYSVMKPFRKEAAEEWIEWSEMKALTSAQRLLSGDVQDVKIGSLDSNPARISVQMGTDLERLEACKSTFISDGSWCNPENRVFYGSSFKVGPISFEPPYTNIRFSRFCAGKLLETREEVRGIVQNHTTKLKAQGLNDMDNVCGGHTSKRVYESMAKSCDVELKNFEVLCFTQLTWDYVTKTDFDLQKKEIQKLYDSVGLMGKDRSLFLCRYPMLTRLQTGMIFCLASVFEKVIIYGDPSKNVVGIMLHKFKGLRQPDARNMFRCISDILGLLNDKEHNFPCLQLAPMNLLLDSMPVDFLVRYNTLLLCQDMFRIINVVEFIIRLGEMGCGA